MERAHRYTPRAICCILSHSLCSLRNFPFFSWYPSWALHWFQTLRKISDASSFSFAPLWLALFGNSMLPSTFCCRLPSRQLIDSWRQQTIWINFLHMSMPTKSSSLSYCSNRAHRSLELLRATSGVRNRQSGNRDDLYGSKVSTPCSPRPMR
ncbi:hypothetical protein MPH_09465 [Macrophomina phaseolina MS6]|uniref:Uncharacterized protein n=1 Tax=Macrophomina phaseolina (strain MS6) TaxID=1126212 RepID=K2RTB3_MACPH|nr:hypothetical protein MPH_09465 [Macrophomina phaseolina MS6]